jgi:hypothetical protein
VTAWRNLSSDERDRIFLVAALLNEPGPIHVNPRSKNDREWTESMVARGLLSKRLSITRRGKARLKTLGATPVSDTGGPSK